MNNSLTTRSRSLLLVLTIFSLVLVFFPTKAKAATKESGTSISFTVENHPLHAADGNLVAPQLMESHSKSSQQISTSSFTKAVNGPFYETGAFVPNQTLPIYSDPGYNKPISGLTYAPGEVIYYDSYYVTCEDDYCAYGRVFISYISYSGERRYVPIRPHQYGVYGSTWGYFLY